MELVICCKQCQDRTFQNQVHVLGIVLHYRTVATFCKWNYIAAVLNAYLSHLPPLIQNILLVIVAPSFNSLFLPSSEQLTIGQLQSTLLNPCIWPKPYPSLSLICHCHSPFSAHVSQWTNSAVQSDCSRSESLCALCIVHWQQLLIDDAHYEYNTAKIRYVIVLFDNKNSPSSFNLFIFQPSKNWLLYAWFFCTLHLQVIAILNPIWWRKSYLIVNS